MHELTIQFPRCTLYLAIHAALNPAGNREISGFVRDESGQRLPILIEGEYVDHAPTRTAGRPADPSRQIAIAMMHRGYQFQGNTAGEADTAIVEKGFFSDQRAVKRSRKAGNTALAAWRPGVVISLIADNQQSVLIFQMGTLATLIADGLEIDGPCWRWHGGRHATLDYVKARYTIPDPDHRQRLAAAFREG